MSQENPNRLENFLTCFNQAFLDGEPEPLLNWPVRAEFLRLLRFDKLKEFLEILEPCHHEPYLAEIVQRFQDEIVRRSLIGIPRDFNYLRQLLEQHFPTDPLTELLKPLTQTVDNTDWIDQEAKFLSQLQQILGTGSRFEKVIGKILYDFLPESPNKAATNVVFIRRGEGQNFLAEEHEQYLRPAIIRPISTVGNIAQEQRIFLDTNIGNELKKTAFVVQRELMGAGFINNLLQYYLDDLLIYWEQFHGDGRSAGLAFAFLAVAYNNPLYRSLAPYLACFGCYEEGIITQVAQIIKKVETAKESGIRILVLPRSNILEVQDYIKECHIIEYPENYPLEDVLTSIVENMGSVAERFQEINATLKPKRKDETNAWMRKVYLLAQQPTLEERRQMEYKIENVRDQRSAGSRQRRERHRERVVGDIPSAIAHFKDRVDELRLLRELLADEKLRFVLIGGRGGMGKTALITKLLHDIQQDFSSQLDAVASDVDSIVYVPLHQSESRSPYKIVELICRTLEPDDAAELRAMWQKKIPLDDKLEFLFRHVLKQRRCLIVLDNFEDVLDEANRIRYEFAELRQFVEKCIGFDTGACIVATSQRTLVLPPEVEGRVGERKAELTLYEGLPEVEAIALLQDLDKDGRLGIKDAPLEILREVVRSCHYIPRTIETLVGTLRQRRTWTLARLLDDEAAFARLTDNPAQELYESLSPEERLVMQALAVYDRPVPAAAVRYLLPGLPVDDILDAFVRNYIVAYDRDLFSLLQLDQQYAYRQIPDDGNDYTKRALHRRVAEYYKQLRKPRNEWKKIDDLEPQLQEFHHLVRADQYDQACKILNEIDPDYLHRWGHYRQVIKLREQLIEKIKSNDLVGTNLSHLGRAYRDSGEARRAIQYFEQALTIARNIGTLDKERANLGGLGSAYLALGDTPKALEYFEQALTVAHKIPDPISRDKSLATALADLGNAYNNLGKIPKAIECYEQALKITRRFHLENEEGRNLGNLGRAHFALKEVDKAIEYYKQALTIAQGLNNRHVVEINLAHLGRAYSTLGEMQKAIEYYEQALQIAREIHDLRGEGINLANIGMTYAALGETQKAMEHYERALQIARKTFDRRTEAMILGYIGVAYAASGETQKAMEHRKQALQIASEIRDRRQESIDFYRLGEVYHRFGNLAEARRYYEKAIELDILSTDYSCAVKLGIFCLEEGKAEEAQDYFARGIALCRALLEKTPRLYDTLYYLALAQLGSGQPEESLATYRQALEVCSAKGVAHGAIQDLRLLKRAAQVEGNEQALMLLEKATGVGE